MSARGIVRGISGAYGASMPPRSRRRRGYIEPLPSGSFRAVVFVGIDPLTRRRRYIRETRKTRPEAEKELTRLQRDVDLNRQAKSAITVAEAIEQWMTVAELGNNPGPIRGPDPALHRPD